MTRTNLPTCPWCGHIEEDYCDWNIEEGSPLEGECPECEKTYETTIYVDIHFRSKKVKND